MGEFRTARIPNVLRRRAAEARQLAEISSNVVVSAMLKELAQRLEAEAQSEGALVLPYAPRLCRNVGEGPLGAASNGAEPARPLSRGSIEILLDLVEIKVSYMDVADVEDRRDLRTLERCRQELQQCLSPGIETALGPIRRGRGRPRLYSH